HADFEPAVGTQRLLGPQPRLALAHGLAGIEGARAGAGGARVFTHLVGRQALRVLRADVEAVGGQRQRGAAAGGAGQPHLGDVAAGAAVVAIAAAVQVLGVDPVAALPALPALAPGPGD